MLSGIVPTAVAQVRGPATREARSLSIPAGPLDDALKALARQSGIQLLYSAVLVAPLRSRPVSGAPSVAAALAMLLDGTGLRAVAVTDDAFVIEKVPQKPRRGGATPRSSIPVDRPVDVGPVTVTGTHIPRVPVASRPKALPRLVFHQPDAAPCGCEPQIRVVDAEQQPMFRA